MIFNYFDIIAESTEKYRRALSYLISIIVFLFFLLFTSDEVDLRNYHYAHGHVYEINKDKIKVKPSATFSIKEYVFMEVILIKIENEYYYINKQYKTIWDDVLINVLKNDYVEVHYRISEGYKFLVHIKKNEFDILSIDVTRESQNKLRFLFSFLFCLFSSILIVIAYKRKMWLKK